MASHSLARYPLLALGCAAAGYSCQGVLETSAKRLAQLVVDLRDQEATPLSRPAAAVHQVSSKHIHTIQQTSEHLQRHLWQVPVLACCWKVLQVQQHVSLAIPPRHNTTLRFIAFYTLTLAVPRMQYLPLCVAQKSAQ